MLLKSFSKYAARTQVRARSVLWYSIAFQAFPRPPGQPPAWVSWITNIFSLPVMCQAAVIWGKENIRCPLHPFSLALIMREGKGQRKQKLGEKDVGEGAKGRWGERGHVVGYHFLGDT